MVIYIQDFLARQRDATRQVHTRLLAVGGGQVQSATMPRVRYRTTFASPLVSHGQVASDFLPCTPADMLTLYAEATLI